MHSGAAIAGIIGHKTFQYDLCGDAVNTSARMCTYSAPGQLHVSEDSYRLLAHRYAAICRGTREIKGKGDMTTYYVLNLPSGKETEALLADRTKLRLSAPDDEAPIDKLMMTLEA